MGQDYLLTRPAKGWLRHGQTRSEVEQGIVFWLVGKTFGASDDRSEVADEHFAKHQEEWPKQGDAYINRTIASARRRHYDEGGSHPRWRLASPSGCEVPAPTVDDLEGLLKLVHGQCLADWVREVWHLGQAEAPPIE